MTDSKEDGLRFADLRRANVERQEHWGGSENWTLADWSNAVAGEVGEACNVVKKIRRPQLGTVGNDADAPKYYAQLESEIGDVLIYLDLLAKAAGFTLDTCVSRAFNEKSEKLGMPVRLSAYSPPVGGSGEVVALDRETIARAIYETDPHYESAEYVDSFPVSPGGTLTWEQALARDAEFAGDRIMLPITKFAFDAADRIRSALAAPVPNGVPEGWCDMSTAPTDGTHILVRFDGTSSPPTVAHWFGPPPLPGLRAGGWYLSVQQFEGPQIHPTRWMPVPEDRLAASPVTPEGLSGGEK